MDLTIAGHMRVGERMRYERSEMQEIHGLNRKAKRGEGA